MFPYPIATPQGCNIQTFYGSGELITPSEGVQYSWNKPVGVSHVYMMLISGGGIGDGTNGGGSGAVTIWYGAAQHVPDSLVIEVAGSGQGQNTQVAFRNAATFSYLLRANTASGATSGTATTAGPFAASGFYKSTAGQNGSSSANSASTTTFLSGAGTGPTSTSNYGYVNVQAGTNYTHGYFLMQPIIVGVAGINDGDGGIGCGGAPASAKGGPGMVLIASW
jgi:hypothetical protein